MKKAKPELTAQQRYTAMLYDRQQFVRNVIKLIEAEAVESETPINLSPPEESYCWSMQRAGYTAAWVAAKIIFTRDATGDPIHRRSKSDSSNGSTKPTK